MRPPGIEPGTLTWEASILPLYYEREIIKRLSFITIITKNILIYKSS